MNKQFEAICDEVMKKREEGREEMVRARKREAEEQKRRMLAMYDQMAKSAPGPQKVIDINIYKNAEPSPAQDLPLPPTRDLVEEAIQERQREAEERKRKVLAAYDAAAKSGHPGPKSPDYSVINDSTSGMLILEQNFKNLYISKQGADVTIMVKGRKFLAHRRVLIIYSSVFSSMFGINIDEKNDGMIKIIDCDPDLFEDFLLFIYTGTLDNVISKNVICLYELADKYDFKELKKACVQCMINELTIDSLCDVFQIGIMYSDTDIMLASTNYFLQNTVNVLKTLQWQKFSVKNPLLLRELFLKYVMSLE